MNQADRIAELAKAANKSQSDVARSVGVSPQAVAKWFKDPNVKIESGNMDRLAECLRSTGRYIREGTKYSHNGEFLGAENTGMGPAIRTELPLIDSIQAGQRRDIMNPYEVGEHEKLVPVTKHYADGSFVLRIEGDSMVADGTGDSFPEGCLVAFDVGKDARNGSYVAVRFEDEVEATFKQLVIDGARQYLKPLNRRYPIIEIDRPATICGVAREVIMDLDR